MDDHQSLCVEIILLLITDMLDGYIDTFLMFEFQFMPNFHQTKRSFLLLICQGQLIIVLFWSNYIRNYNKSNWS